MTFSPGHLGSLLSACAMNAPAQFRDQRSSRGFTEAGVLLEQARACGQLEAAQQVMIEFLKSGDADEQWLALVFLPLDILVQAGLGDMKIRSPHDDAEEELRIKRAWAVAGRLIPYSEALRGERRLIGGTAMVGPILLFDQEWALAHIPEVFDPKLGPPDIALHLALAHFTHAEVDGLHAALARAPASELQRELLATIATRCQVS